MAAMTKDERNKRTADLRFQKLSARYQSLKSSILELWLRAKREQLSFNAILQYRNGWIFGTGYDSLPDWVKHKLEGAWDICNDLAYRQDFAFCYPHPRTGTITPADVICNEGLASELADKGLDKQGGHYWKNADGTIGKPFFTG